MIGSNLIRCIFSRNFLNKIKHALGWETDYWFELEKISQIPRCQPAKTNLVIPGLQFIDSESFINQYIEIFEKKSLHFDTNKKTPRILDCGSNIGLSIIFFKNLYPDSNITGFEPDPKVFAILAKNLNSYLSNDLEIINKAVWHEETSLLFSPDNADGGTIDENGMIEVKTVNLNDYLTEKIDFLKIDIEGAEHNVLPSIVDRLCNIKFLFLEVHLDNDKPDQIEKTFQILRENNFRYSFNTVKNITFKELVDSAKLNHMFDQQLNIFAVNENS